MEVICKFCNSKHVDALRKIQSPYSEEKYTLYECRSCKQRFFRMDESENSSDILKKLYDSQAEKNKNVYGLEFTPSKYWKNEVKEITELHLGKIHSICDIGCRTGDFLMHWPNRVERVGVELSEYASGVAQQRGIHVVRDFVENASFDHPFDVVSCYALLEHLEQPKLVLDTFSRMCSQGGVLVILVPAFDTWKQHTIWKNENERWHMYSPPEHLNFYTKEWLVEYLSPDFELLRYKYTTGGMVNPFRGIPLLSRIGGRLMWMWDVTRFTNQKPIFDHLYLYFRRK